MGSSKQKWQRPELVVLLRTRPEEAVLAGCKARTSAGPARKCRTEGGSECVVMTES